MVKGGMTTRKKEVHVVRRLPIIIIIHISTAANNKKRVQVRTLLYTINRDTDDGVKLLHLSLRLGYKMFIFMLYGLAIDQNPSYDKVISTMERNGHLKYLPKQVRMFFSNYQPLTPYLI